MFLQGGRCGPLDHEFDDESFHVKHTEIGLLGMCKRGGVKHSNETQFYITLGAPLNFLDNENVVFGRVISGMHFLEEIEKLETVNEKADVKIVDCGRFKV